MHELRKVQETSKRTLIISLPRRWGARFPVAAGDHLQLSLQSDGSVLMRRHGASHVLPVTEVPARGQGSEDVLGRMEEPFLRGAPSVSVTGLASWLEPDLALLRQRVRERFAGEAVEESQNLMHIVFLGADRPEQAAVAFRRLVHLACDALRGHPHGAHELERHRLLAGRLLLLGARQGPARETLARTGLAALQVAAIAALAECQEPPCPASEPAVEAFRRAALAAIEGRPAPSATSLPGAQGHALQVASGPAPTAGDMLAWTAARTLLRGLGAGGQAIPPCPPNLAETAPMGWSSTDAVAGAKGAQDGA